MLKLVRIVQLPPYIYHLDLTVINVFPYLLLWCFWSCWVCLCFADLRQHDVSVLCSMVWGPPNKDIYLRNHSSILTADKSFINSLISSNSQFIFRFPQLPSSFPFYTWFIQIKIQIRSRYFICCFKFLKLF